MKKPINMPQDTYEALLMMLESPWYKWHNACGMKRIFAFWRIRQFIHNVKVTKQAIRSTLNYKTYPSGCIPSVEVTNQNGTWCLSVHTWGKPELQRV